MKNHSRTTVFICVVALINILWIVINIYSYGHAEKILKTPGLFLYIFILPFLFSAASHLIMLIYLVFHFRNSRKYFLMGLVLFITGIISFIMHFFHFAGLNDFLVLIREGYSATFMNIVIIQSLEVVFYVYAIVYFRLPGKTENHATSAPGIRGENLFIIMNITGIICSIAGLLMMSLIYHYFNEKFGNLFHDGTIRFGEVRPFLFILLPYCIIFSVWLFFYIKDKRRQRIDEKLQTDVNKSGFWVMILSFILVCGMMIRSFTGVPVSGDIYIDGRMTILWLPIYLFLIILLFSCLALYNFKRN